MKITLTQDESANRLMADQYAGWTRAGAFALVEYLEALEADLGDELDFDIVALRCEYSEYKSLQDWADDRFRYQDAPDDLRAYIEDRGTLIEFEGGIIVSNF